MYSVTMYFEVRQRCLRDGVSIRQAAKDFCLSRRTVSKMLAHAKPPGYRRQAAISQPVLDPFKAFIDEILVADKKVHRKQRHTAKRIYARLQSEEGYTGSYATVRKYRPVPMNAHQDASVYRGKKRC